MQRQRSLPVLLRDEGDGAVFVSRTRRHVQDVLQKGQPGVPTLRQQHDSQGQLHLRCRLLLQGSC